jgi:hypothetical protein
MAVGLTFKPKIEKSLIRRSRYLYSNSSISSRKKKNNPILFYFLADITTQRTNTM